MNLETESHTMSDDRLGTRLALVTDRRRRRLREYLRHNGNGEMPIDDFVDQLDQPGSDVVDERRTNRDQLAIQLNHRHLPELADHGIVEHDRDRGTIEYRSDEQIEAVLDGLPGEPSLTDP